MVLQECGAAVRSAEAGVHQQPRRIGRQTDTHVCSPPPTQHGKQPCGAARNAASALTFREIQLVLHFVMAGAPRVAAALHAANTQTDHTVVHQNLVHVDSHRAFAILAPP